MMHELLVGLTVRDEAGYQQYRDAMGPILRDHGGRFRYDFTVAATLRSESTHPINRMFVLSFPDRASKDAFFSHPDYKAVRARHFESSVAGATIIAEYER